MTVPTVKLRYFAYNCLEIKLPDGKTLVIDPCLQKEGQFACGYDETALEGCDYVLVNHSHVDHVDTLGKVYDRFHPMIYAHAHTAQALAKYYDIPYIMITPFTTGDEFILDSFKFQVVRGQHNTTKAFMVRPSGRVDEFASAKFNFNFEDPELQFLMDAGTQYDSNFLITLSNNLRIGFFAGNPGMVEPQDKYLWSQLRPDIVFAHRAKWTDKNYADKMSNVLAVTGARLMMPIHIEDAYKDDYSAAEYMENVNRVCEEKGIAGRMMFLEKAQWYEFTTGVRKL